MSYTYIPVYINTAKYDDSFTMIISHRIYTRREYMTLRALEILEGAKALV